MTHRCRLLVDARSKRRRLRLVVAAVAAAAPSIYACGADRAPSFSGERPNIVLISVDSLRADHLGCYGYPRSTSPEIDGLAAEGALFEVATSSSSWTLPAHAALFTGLPDSAHGVDRGSRTLAPERRTLAEALQAAGYRTAGVWSGPLLDPRFGFGQGFDAYAGHSTTDEDWDRAVTASHQIVTGPGILEKVDTLLAPRTEGPFFLFVHLWDVHYDYIPPAPYDSMFDPHYSGEVDGRDLVDYLKLGLGDLSRRDLEHLVALYDGEIAWTDQQIGQILRKLEALGVAEDTVVIVTSDHGEELFDHGSFGHKRKLFDESIRIPLVVRYPGRIPAGKRIGQPVRIVDVAPTIVELAGAEPLPDVMGRSLVPLVGGRSVPRPPLAVSELVENPETGESLLAVRAPHWKILLRPSSGSIIGLWNLEEDPREQTNVYQIDRELTTSAVGSLRAALAELERLRDRHGASHETSKKLDADLQKQLESLGYLGVASVRDTESPLRATPNPIQVCDGPGLGVTTLSWNLPGAGGVLEVRVDSPDGKLFAQTGATGSATTGKWARDGMMFFLVEGDTGKVLGRTVIRVTRSGCRAE